MRSFAALVLALALAVPALAQENLPPQPQGSWLADGAGILSIQQASEITGRLDRIERTEGVRVVVVTVAKTLGEAPKSLAMRSLNEWNIGTRSVALLVCMEPHDLYIQPGNDLVERFSPAASSAICRDRMAPRMRAHDFAGAVNAGLDGILERLHAAPGDEPASSSTAPPPPPPVYRSYRERRAEWSHLVVIVLGVAACIGVIWLFAVLTTRKCNRCGANMSKYDRTVQYASYSHSGWGERTYTCRSCGHSYQESYTIPMLTSSYSSSSWDNSSSSSSSWFDTSSSSSSSWDSSSSSSSSFDSGSSSSSSGDGGGGSSW